MIYPIVRGHNVILVSKSLAEQLLVVLLCSSIVGVVLAVMSDENVDPIHSSEPKPSSEPVTGCACVYLDRVCD